MQKCLPLFYGQYVHANLFVPVGSGGTAPFSQLYPSTPLCADAKLKSFFSPSLFIFVILQSKIQFSNLAKLLEELSPLSHSNLALLLFFLS